MPPPEYQLIVEDVHLSFGGLKALSGVSTAVRRG
jgi:ABC-type branched-subunit amino acid transport system ATPase component